MKKEKMPLQHLMLDHDDMQHPELVHQLILKTIWSNALTNFRLISMRTSKSNISNTRPTCNGLGNVSSLAGHKLLVSLSNHAHTQGERVLKVKNKVFLPLSSREVLRVQERKEKVSMVKEKRCEGDHTVPPYLLHLAPPTAREELVGGSLRGRLFYIHDLEGTLPSPRGRKIRRFSTVTRRVKIALGTPPRRLLGLIGAGSNKSTQDLSILLAHSLNKLLPPLGILLFARSPEPTAPEQFARLVSLILQRAPGETPCSLVSMAGRTSLSPTSNAVACRSQALAENLAVTALAKSLIEATHVLDLEKQRTDSKGNQKRNLSLDNGCWNLIQIKAQTAGKTMTKNLERLAKIMPMVELGSNKSSFDFFTWGESKPVAIHDYMGVSTCKTCKEIWDKLCITYEGTNEVKQSRLNILLHDYELFCMKPHESISDMYRRFTQIVTSLHALRRELLNFEKVNKILRCLPSSYDAKITTITESKDLNTYSIDNLLGSLIAYEQGVNQRNLDAGEKKKEKIVALKVHKSDSESSGKPRHVKDDCPTLQDHSSKEKEKGEEKPKFKKDKKRFQKAFWAESGTDSSKTEPEEETTNLCLMGEDNLEHSDEKEGFDHHHPSLIFKI
ncbi:hypothetical protein KFK09_014898 [Dendrobium nobile]|uniref:UBN2 domain-containing protein n=1 Tax=Dendrobium nobile TaxID=94219 RepID=A0A8T3B4F0_DENNO|nr:hypothetical protein KFK09_014898 [Dendrobium nobile]